MEQKDRLEELYTCFRRELKGTLRSGEGELEDNNQLKNQFIPYHRFRRCMNLFRLTTVLRNWIALTKYVIPALNSKWKDEN